MGSSKLTKTMQNEHSSPPFDPSWWICVFWSQMICVRENSNIFYFLNYKPLLLANSQMFIDVNVRTCWYIIKLNAEGPSLLISIDSSIGLPVIVQRSPLSSLCMVFAFTCCIERLFTEERRSFTSGVALRWVNDESVFLFDGVSLYSWYKIEIVIVIPIVTYTGQPKVNNNNTDNKWSD